jgi:hypothetical protein
VLATYFVAEGAWPEDSFYTPVTGTNQAGLSDGKPDPDRPAHYNPYISDLGLPMPSVPYLCTAPGITGTDQLICWGNADSDGVPQEESIRLAGYNCENCCADGAEECFDYLYTVPRFVTRSTIKDYCCKGKLKPDFETLKSRTLAMSAAEEVRPPECREYGGEFDLNRNPNPDFKGLRSCFMPHLGLSCEACCYNPDAHPVQWTSDYMEKVKENHCWNTDRLEATLGVYVTALTPYDKWQKCCQDSGCDPAVHVWICIWLWAIPYAVILFFACIVAGCAIFEWALIGNKLCFKNPPQDQDPFALVNNAAEGAKEATQPPPKNVPAAEEAKPKPVKPSAVAPATAGAGALE